MRRPRLTGVAVAALAAALGACASTSSAPPEAAAIDAPPAWRAPIDGSDAVSAGWWSAFGDPQLTQAVEAALARNADLAVAEARVREAEALARQARSALAPVLTGAVSAQNARTLNAFGQASEAATAQPQLSIAYEADLWGRLRDADAAGRASLEASRYARDAATLSIAAATARAYVLLVSLDAQLQTARDTLASREAALTVARRRAERGYTSQLEFNQAEAERQAAAQRVPALELAVRRQENALSVLTGQTPGRTPRGRVADLRLPAPAPGLPSALLARRPDLAQAEAQLRAADASLSAADKALLPQVRLTASLGELFVEHIDPMTVWSLGGSVLAPLFDGGRLSAQADAAEARRDQLAFVYRGAVLNAFAETENALEGVTRLTTQFEAAARQRDAQAEALRRAHNRYEAGYASYLEELDAQRGLFGAELAVIQLQELRLTNAVNLYQALGGGWTPAGR